MSFIGKIKKALFQNKEQTNTYPRKFLAVRWTNSARKSGLKGDRNKRIVVVENGKEKTKKYPYTPETLTSLKEGMRLPVLDETGGQEKPDADFLEKYDPGKISWD